MSSKYDGREFVMITNYTSDYAHTSKELPITQAFFASKFFTRDEFLEFTASLVRIRPGYRSQGGSEYATLEAGHRFKTLLNNGVIRELTQGQI
jgi:hypothetical protein